MFFSSHQKQIFNDFRDNDNGNSVIVARAGSGKTTTIVEALSHAPACKSLFLAFNKSIASELKNKVPKGVKTMTTHGLGYAMVRKATELCDSGAAVMDDKKLWRIASRVLIDAGCVYNKRKGGDVIALPIGYSQIKEIVQWSKNLAVDFRDPEAISRIAYLRGLTQPIEGNDPAELAQRVLAACYVDSQSIDFDDMIWLPYAWDLPAPKYDLVVIDEAQDLNKCQHLLIKKLQDNGAKIVAVGDDRQSIYQFRGANPEGINDLAESLQAKTFKLPITYRCPISVVKEANHYVSDIIPTDTAPQGIVKNVKPERLEEDLKPGDFVLSRSNSPLVSLCFHYIAKQVPARIVGRDIGKGLKDLVKKSRAKTPDQLIVWVNDWEQDLKEKLEGRDETKKLQESQDQAEVIRNFSDYCEDINEINQAIEYIFQDRTDDNVIRFSSVHKAKGLEADNVWLIAESFRPRESTEEENILYVAITRSKKTLTIAGAYSEEKANKRHV